MKTDILVIGSGLGGLSAALQAADFARVLVVTKRRASDSNTSWAQGGVACVMDKDDTIAAHVADTLIAGAGLCKDEVVQSIISAGPARIADLTRLGVQFTRRAEMAHDGHADEGDPEGYDLGREGGHSARRVLHAGDITGTEIIRALLAACRQHPNITLLEDHHAVDLISSRRLDWDGPNRCLGAYVLDRRTKEVATIMARFVVLATGGAGRAYLYTTNPEVACGEGIAMAYRAYAEIANMEFYQFHPTLLYHPACKSFLISEAVRGEGAILKARNGDTLTEFMQDYHHLASLAPRDIVARAIDREIKKTGQPCVYLDIRHHQESYLKKRFPNIFATCMQYGLNMATDPIPVVPAAHYLCGGVRTDVQGRTCVTGLYAVGEVGCTGLHGANRLASNSLLEALVVGHEAAADIRAHYDEADRRHLDDASPRRVPDWSSGPAVDADELVVLYHNWDEIRRCLWDYVGIFRTTKRLERAKDRAHLIRKEIERNYWDFTVTPELLELRNLVSVAEMIIDCALARRESIGLHYNADYPEADPSKARKETILRRPGFEKFIHWQNG